MKICAGILVQTSSHSLAQLTMAPATAKKPKKKNAPDKPMPEWMFPDDEKNPVLNRKKKPEEQILKEKNEWDQAVNFLQHKSVSAPLKPPPPALLLTLVGAFLTSYGFNNASRIYTTQLSSRKKLDDWKFELGEQLPKGFPDLVEIFKDWYKEYRERVHLDETSSEDDDDNTTQAPKSIKKKKKKAEKGAAAVKESGGSSSSSGSSKSSSDESEADIGSESALPAPKTVERASLSASSSSSSSTSSSDSDADDEQEAVQKPMSASSSSSSDQSSSSSDSDSSPPPPRASKSAQRADKQAPIETPQSDASRGTKKASKKTTETVPPSKPPQTTTKSSSSSATLEIASPQKPAKTSASNTSSDSSSESSSSSSDSSAQFHNAGVPLSPSKRKRYDSSPVPQPPAKKSRTPFQRVPNDTKVDARLASNAYVSHEYGDRAHQDLSVTRGKGFTKEKNKKKRGSYRGGAIDVGGGKGIKFED